jgi:hypothetical protein
MLANAEAAIACSLGAEDLDQRVDWIQQVTDRSLLSHQLDTDTLRLTYRQDAVQELQQIVAKERECCSFLHYSLQPSDDVVRLTIEAPEGTGAQARWLFNQFVPEARPARTKACGCAPGVCG